MTSLPSMAIVSAALLTAALPLTASADASNFSIGLDVTRAQGATWRTGATEERVSAGLALKPSLSYRIDDHWAVEASYYRVDAERNGTRHVVSQWPVSAVYRFPALSDGLSLFGKLGLSPMSTSFKDGTVDRSEQYLGVAFGLGLNYALSQTVALVGGLDFLNGEKVSVQPANLEYRLSPAHVYLGARFRL